MYNRTVSGQDGDATVEEHVHALNTQAWETRKINTEQARQTAQHTLAISRHQLSGNPSSLFWKRELGRALLALAAISARLSEYTAALELAEEALPYLSEAGYTAGHIYALATMSRVHNSLGGYEKARALAEEGMKLAAELDDPEVVGVMMNVMGMISWVLGDHPQALDWFLKSLAAVEKVTKCREITDVLNNLGMMYSSLGDYDKGLEYGNTALLSAREYGDKASEGTALINLGILYIQQDELDTAREYLLQGLAINEELGNKSGQMHTLVNLASAELELDNTGRAEEYVLTVLELAQITGERRMESYALVVLGNLYSKRGEYDTAMEYYRTSLAMRNEIGYRLGETESLLTIGTLAVYLGRHAEALIVLHEALALAEQLQAKVMISQIHEKLADAYEQSGDTAKALYHHRIFYRVQKESFNEQAMIRQKSLQVFYEVQQTTQEAEIYRLKNVELAEANAEILRKKHDLEEHTKTIRKAHDELLEKSIELERMNHDKDEFIGIAVHGLKNPLSLVIMAASMLRKNSERMTKEELDKNLEWIEIAAWRMEELVLKLLQSNAIESGRTEFVPHVVEIAPLLSPIVQEYGRRASAKGISLVAEGLDSNISAFADTSMMRDIIDNLVSNAVKFSPPDTTIRVRILTGEQPVAFTDSGHIAPTLRISVQDEGPGITDDDMQRMFGKFERLSAKPTGGEHSTGLGLSIVKKLTEIMGGKIWCESAPGAGAMFVVELPAVAGA